jgi:hypothetical protein
MSSISFLVAFRLFFFGATGDSIVCALPAGRFVVLDGAFLSIMTEADVVSVKTLNGIKQFMCHTRLTTVSKVTAGLEDSLDRPTSICSRLDIGCTVVKSRSCVETCSEPADSICTDLPIIAVTASERCHPVFFNNIC